MTVSSRTRIFDSIEELPVTIGGSDAYVDVYLRITSYGEIRVSGGKVGFYAEVDSLPEYQIISMRAYFPQTETVKEVSGTEIDVYFEHNVGLKQDIIKGINLEYQNQADHTKGEIESIDFYAWGNGNVRGNSDVDSLDLSTLNNRAFTICG